MNIERMNVREAAEFLKVHPQTIRRWIKLGYLPAQKVGFRKVRIRREDLLKMIKFTQKGKAETILSFLEETDGWGEMKDEEAERLIQEITSHRSEPSEREVQF